MKICTSCKKNKKLSEFYWTQERGRHGIYCRGCWSIYQQSDKVKENKKKYWLSEKGLENKRIYQKTEKYKKMRRENINLQIGLNLRRRTSEALKKRYKSGSAVRDLGCSIAELRLYIENQFEPGMSWKNYGEWHLDHVIPLSHFNLEDRMEFFEAVNWLNIRPLWAKENIIRGNKIV